MGRGGRFAIEPKDPYAGSAPLLEPPGFMLLNYGRQTPVVTVVAHVAYGAIVGGFVSLAG